MDRPLTGRKVFLIIAAMFGTIIAVNLTLAVNAVKTFPGLEVPNSYIASQGFDARRAAQEGLGWQVDATYSDGMVTVLFRDRDGDPVTPHDLDVTLGRPTTDADDLSLHVDPAGRALVDLAPGRWRLDVAAVSTDGTPVTKRLTLWVRP